MDTNYNNRISFEARLINNKLKIYKTDKILRQKKPVSVSLVEIKTKEDAETIQETSDLWGLNSQYSEDIAYTAEEMTKSDRSPYYNNSRVYALTYQMDNFDKLDSNSVLGMVEVRKLSRKQIRIPFIQADPKIVFSFDRDIDGIGTAIIDGLKSIYHRITLRSEPTKTVKHFHEKNGFVQIRSNDNLYVWEKSLKDKIKDFCNFITFWH